MTQLSDSLTAKVIELLTKYGEPASFVRKSEGVYNPSTATATTPVAASYSGMVYRYPYSQYERANTLIQTEDQRIYAHKMTAEPKVGDEVTVDSVAYRIMMVDKITLSGAKLLFQLQVRA